MASPFRVFRKHQKTLLVGAGIIAIFVFVLGDSLMQLVGRTRGGSGRGGQLAPNAVAVRWDDGSITNAELDNLVMRRRILNSFIQGVEFAGRQAALQAGIEPRRLHVDPIVGPETPQQGVERSVVRTRLFAQAAREAGMRVADETIVHYLDELGRGNVSRDQMRAMLKRLGSGHWRVSIDYVINALREEMLARNYIASNQFAFATLTPQQRWKDWLQVNDRVVIEAAAMPVEQFLVDVPEPTDAELRAFFDKYKNRESQPDFVGQMEFPSPTPGFRIPRKIDVQFIEANYDQYLAKIEDEISDEEIEAYYEKNKDPLFIKADTGLIDEPTDSPPDNTTGEPDDGKAAADTETTTQPPVESPDTKPSDESAAPATTDEPATTNEPATTSEPETTNEPATSEEPAASDEPSTPNEGDQSSRGESSRHGTFRLVAFLQDADSEDAPAEEKATETPPEATETVAPDTTSASSESAPPAGTEPPAETSTPADSSNEAPAATPPAEEKPKEFQPLDEVRGLIRRQLAEQRAADELNKLVHKLASQLQGEFDEYLGQVFDAESQESEPPAPPVGLADLAPLAKEHGLEYGTTGPLSQLELRDTPLGKSGDIQTGDPLWLTLFGNRDLELYQPVVTVDIDGNRYVAMKTGDTPGRVPKLAEVKDEVVQAWKHGKAAELALKHAEAEAEKAEQAGSSLADFFAENKSVEVVRTDPFSQLTGGDVALVGGQIQTQPFRLSEPDGVVAAGPEFLQRVFELKDSEVAAVLNHDHSIAYVIRIVEHMSSPEELHTAYLSEANTWPGLRLMINSHAQIARAHLVNDIVTDAGLQWERNPDQPQQDEEEAG